MVSNTSGGASSNNALHKALVEAQCNLWMEHYKHSTATVEQKQFYASCVRQIHPIQSPSPTIEAKMAVGAILVLALLCIAVSGYKTKKSLGSFFGVAECIGAVVFGLIAWLVILCAVGLVICAFKFFTA